MKFRSLHLAIISLIVFSDIIISYPIDGYSQTGIRRLYRIQLIIEGVIKDTKPIKGAMKSIDDIKLNLKGKRGDSLAVIPEPNEKLQKEIDKLFPNRDESYSISLLDITPGKKIRYAQRQQTRNFSPGSVGKLAIAAGLFAELKKLYPESFEKRQQLLKTRMVRAGKWAISNHHTVPTFIPETKEFYKRTVQESDIFSLYEWADHMLSVSSNAAASVVWKELVLMRAFKNNYPPTAEQEIEFFKKTPKKELSEMAMDIVNAPLQAVGISEDEWHLGSMFTREAKNMIPGKGGSTANPLGLMKYLIAMERGKIVDESSSLEIKRLLYMTDRRIRYAQSAALSDAAVYFKSGSLYKCKPEEGFECKKYMGNVDNYMNSVAIVEHPNGATYLVALMSNVLKKNSGTDHMMLAGQIDKIIKM